MATSLVKRIRPVAAGSWGARRTRRGDGAARPVRNETADRILACGLEIFAERGFDGTTTREIASRAGVNLGLIKYYYDGKEKLWKAAVDEVVAQLWRSIGGAAGAAPNDAGEIADVIRACVRFAARNPAFVRLMNDECKRNSPRMRWLVDRHGKQFYDVAVAVIEKARALHQVPDVPSIHLYYMFIGAIGMIFSQAPECRRLTGVDPTASQAMIEAHADAVVSLFLVRAQTDGFPARPNVKRRRSTASERG